MNAILDNEPKPTKVQLPKLSKEQAIVLTGFTGITCCKFSDFHHDVEKRMDRPVWTHELGDPEITERVKELYREDFLAMLPTN